MRIGCGIHALVQCSFTYKKVQQMLMRFTQGLKSRLSHPSVQINITKKRSTEAADSQLEVKLVIKLYRLLVLIRLALGYIGSFGNDICEQNNLREQCPHPAQAKATVFAGHRYEKTAPKETLQHKLSTGKDAFCVKTWHWDMVSLQTLVFKNKTSSCNNAVQ